jgi:hypothetical protein
MENLAAASQCEPMVRPTGIDRTDGLSVELLKVAELLFSRAVFKMTSESRRMPDYE